MSRPAVIVVGAGLMGRWHAHEARHLGARVLAVVDPDRDRAAALARRSGRCAPFERLEDALAAAGDASVVHVCTSSGTHEPLAAAALAAGRHVLVEKPLASSLAATRQLLDRARAACRMLWPVHQFPFQRGVVQAHAALPTFGPLRHFEMRVQSAGAEGRSDAERDAVAREILPHALALAARFCPLPIAGGEWRLSRSAPGELQVEATVGGVGVSVRVSMRGRPPVNELRLVGEKGTAHCDLFHGFSYVEDVPATRAGKAARPFAVALRQGAAAAANLAWRGLRAELAYPGLRELLGACYRAASGAGPDPIPPAETLAIAEVWERLTVETGRRAGGRS